MGINNGKERNLEKILFSEITSLEEAREVEAYFLGRIEDIDFQIRDKARRKRMKAENGESVYEDWRSDAVNASQILQRRLSELRYHIKKMWTGFAVRGSNNVPPRVLTAVRNAFVLGEVTEEEIMLLLANPHWARQASMLDRVRVGILTAAHITKANILHRLTQLTRDEKDLASLEDLWEHGPTQPSQKTDIGNRLAHLYAVFGRFEDAERVIHQIPEAFGAVECWQRLYRKHARPEYLDHARAKIADVEDVIHRMKATSLVLEVSRSPEDFLRIQQLFSEALPIAFEEARREYIVSLYAGALLCFDREEDARECVRNHTPTGARCLFQIALYSKKRDDLQKALEAPLPHGKAGLAVLSSAIEACLVCKAPEVARIAIDLCEDHIAQAKLWFRLALETGDEEDVAKGVGALTRIPFKASDAARMVYLQVLLKKGRVKEAREQVPLLNQDEWICSAYLYIHCAEQGMPLPENW